MAVNTTRAKDANTCGDVACGQCAPVPEAAGHEQYYVPECIAGVCYVTDLAGSDSTVCTADTDCQIRDGAACCPGCDGTGLVALSSLDYVEQLCAPGAECVACEPEISNLIVARCMDGHCRIMELLR